MRTTIPLASKRFLFPKAVCDVSGLFSHVVTAGVMNGIRVDYQLYRNNAVHRLLIELSYPCNEVSQFVPCSVVDTQSLLLLNESYQLK